VRGLVLGAASLAALLGLALACSRGEPQGGGSDAGTTAPAPPAAPAPATPAPSATSAAPGEAPAKPTATGDPAKGRQIYALNCTACHNADPTKDGALGPAIAGSSLELVTARVLHAAYPPGYTPKRQTQQMVALPHLEPALPDIAAYLQSVKPD
jgi:mono/diheme cytochrome c family protein